MLPLNSNGFLPLPPDMSSPCCILAIFNHASVDTLESSLPDLWSGRLKEQVSPSQSTGVDSAGS